MIVYFDDSLNGLNEGAPVKYRGVTIGSVKRVMVQFNQATNDFAHAGDHRIGREAPAEAVGRRKRGGLHAQTPCSAAYRNGLRATLQTESLVTGVLYMGLDFQPNAPPPVFHQLTEDLSRGAQRADRDPATDEQPRQPRLKSIEKNLNALLINLNTSVSSLHLAEIHDDITKVLGSVDRLVSSPDLKNDLVAVHTTLDQYRLVGEKLNNRIDPLADDVTKTLAEADRALVQVRGAAQNVRIQLAPDAPLPNDLDQALRQLSDALQSLSSLLDFLKQHPNALITGREKLERRP